MTPFIGYLLCLNCFLVAFNQLVVPVRAQDPTNDGSNLIRAPQSPSLILQNNSSLQISPTPTTHLITFIGLIHGYQNNDVARKNFIDNMYKITGGHHVILDNLDPTGAIWHSANITQCAEPEVQQLLSTIRDPDGSFKRDFKMFMGEYFVYPSRIEVKWIGPCENIGRKRGQIESTGSASAAPNSSSAETTSESSLSSSYDMNVETSTAMTTTTTIESTSESELTITTISATNKSAPELTNTAISELNTLLAEGSKNSIEDQRITNTTTPPDSMTNSTPAMNTSAKSIFDDVFEPLFKINGSSSESFAAPSNDFVFDAINNTDSTNYSGGFNMLDKDSKAIDLNEKAEVDGSKVAANEDTATKPSFVSEEPEVKKEEFQETNMEKANQNMQESQSANIVEANSSNAAQDPVLNEQQYGKYVGLVTAFLVFVAYLVCARSYQRQGSYELHEST